MTTAEIVARGAKLLDEHDPLWPHKIRPTWLNMGSCTYCVLGQVYGDFDQGRVALGLLYFAQGSAHPGRYGFDLATIAPSLDAAIAEFNDLRDAWLYEIVARLKPSAVPDSVPDEELVLA